MERKETKETDKRIHTERGQRGTKFMHQALDTYEKLEKILAFHSLLGYVKVTFSNKLSEYQPNFRGHFYHMLLSSIFIRFLGLICF